MPSERPTVTAIFLYGQPAIWRRARTWAAISADTGDLLISIPSRPEEGGSNSSPSTVPEDEETEEEEEAKEI